jgi:hypothetical protein
LDLVTIDQTIDTTLKVKGLLRRRAITCKNAEIEWLYSSHSFRRRMESEATVSGTSARVGDGTEKSESDNRHDMKEGGLTEV